MVLELREVWRSLGDDAVRLALGLPGRVTGCHALSPQQNRQATTIEKHLLFGSSTYLAYTELLATG